MKTCSIDSCDEPVKGRGWCKAHYQRWLDKGFVDPSPIVKKRPGSICDVEGCARAHYARRLCKSHYQRMLSGNPLGGPEFIVHPVPREALSYGAQHLRLSATLGPAREHLCVACGEGAAHWAYQHCESDEMYDPRGFPYSDDPGCYAPMCVSCHMRFDRGSLANTWSQAIA